MSVDDSSSFRGVQTPDDEAALDDLHEMGFTEGTAVRVSGDRKREYFLHLDNQILSVSSDRVSRASPAGVHYDLCYYNYTEVEAGEAFEFLHGDYGPKVTNACLACGTTYPATEQSPCNCPLGSITDNVEWPDVPVRQPRVCIDGEVFTKPE